LIFSTTFVLNFSYYIHISRRIQLDIVIQVRSTYGFVYGARYYYPVVTSLEFSVRVLKYPLHFTKIRPVGAQLFRADGRTDVTNFEKVPKVALWQHIFTNFDRTIVNCEQNKKVDTTPKLTVETFSAIALHTHLICLHSVM